MEQHRRYYHYPQGLKAKKLRKTRARLHISKKSSKFAPDLEKGISEMKKNWIKTVIIALMAVVGLVSCETQEKEEKQRDTFIGEYDYETTGEADLYAGILKIMTVPLNTTGTFSIVPCAEANRLAIVKGTDSIYAVVSGNNLYIEMPTLEYTYADYGEVQLMFSDNKVTRDADNRLHWQSDVVAIGVYGSYTATGNGNIDLVATKQ